MIYISWLTSMICDDLRSWDSWVTEIVDQTHVSEFKFFFSHAFSRTGYAASSRVDTVDYMDYSSAREWNVTSAGSYPHSAF